MRRREFIAFMGLGVMLPLSARAQQSTKTYRIAILHPLWPVAELSDRSRNRYWRELFQEIRRLGYVEGQNLVIERYSGEGRAELYPKLARDVANSRSVWTLCRACHGRAGTSRASASMPDRTFGTNGLSFSGKSSQQYRRWQF